MASEAWRKTFPPWPWPCWLCRCHRGPCSWCVTPALPAEVPAGPRCIPCREGPSLGAETSRVLEAACGSTVSSETRGKGLAVSPYANKKTHKGPVLPGSDPGQAVGWAACPSASLVAACVASLVGWLCSRPALRPPAVPSSGLRGLHCTSGFSLRSSSVALWAGTVTRHTSLPGLQASGCNPGGRLPDPASPAVCTPEN